MPVEGIVAAKGTGALDDAILNEGLALALEWGKDWLMPIQDRLGALHPELARGDLDRYERACRAAMTFGHKQVPSCWREAGREQSAAFALWRAAMLASYPWVSDQNLGGTFSQGMYYAWKNGDVG